MYSCKDKEGTKMENKTKKVSVIFQHFEGCPNGELLLQNLKQAMKGLEDRIEFKEILIETRELAKIHKFRGSPTILINNQDIEGMIEPLNPDLSCRFYAKGLPEVQFIKDKLVKELMK